MFLTRWLQTPSRPRPAVRPLDPRTRFRPRVEALEDRTVPSTFTVKNLNNDGPDSLRAAVVAANANPGADTIKFAGGLKGTILLGSELNITGDLTIDGPGGQKVTVSGNGASRVFDVSVAGINVAIDNLTVTNGRADTGGGVWNAGNLTLFRCVLSSNQAVNP